MYRDIPYDPCLHTCTATPIITITHQNGSFVTKDGCTVTPHKSLTFLSLTYSRKWIKKDIAVTYVKEHSVFYFPLRVL